MEESEQAKATCGDATLMAAPTSGGGGETGHGFGLGVGFALSPELAQKV